MRKIILTLFLCLLSLKAEASTQIYGNPVAIQGSSAAESNHVFTAPQAELIGYAVSNPTAAGFVMVFNAASAPADGAVVPKLCNPIATGGFYSASFGANPASFPLGIVIVFSTTGCFTKTTSGTAFFEAQVN